MSDTSGLSRTGAPQLKAPAWLVHLCQPELFSDFALPHSLEAVPPSSLCLPRQSWNELKQRVTHEYNLGFVSLVCSSHFLWHIHPRYTHVCLLRATHAMNTNAHEQMQIYTKRCELYICGGLLYSFQGVLHRWGFSVIVHPHLNSHLPKIKSPTHWTKSTATVLEAWQLRKDFLVHL